MVSSRLSSSLLVRGVSDINTLSEVDQARIEADKMKFQEIKRKAEQEEKTTRLAAN